VVTSSAAVNKMRAFTPFSAELLVEEELLAVWTWDRRR
jgi:hypothetical protein